MILREVGYLVKHRLRDIMKQTKRQRGSVLTLDIMMADFCLKRLKLAATGISLMVAMQITEKIQLMLMFIIAH